MITQMMVLAAIFTMTATTALQANPITAETAMQNAKTYLVSGPMKKAKGKLTLSLVYTLDNNVITSNEPEPEGLIYVFNINKERGFVIASGDDMVEPILGYCDEGIFDPEFIPEPMKEWIDEYAKEIDWYQTNGYPTATEPLMASTAKKNIDALVKNKWAQGSPFNAKCKFNNVTCVTGCVATAMAQVMYYWAKTSTKGKYKGGSVALKAYTTKTKKYKVGALSATKTFDWANMGTGTPTKSAAKTAVSKLMRYCGQSVKMDYTKTGSGATLEAAAQALNTTFKFNCNPTMKYASSMSSNAWINLIYNEIAAKRPVIMRGSGKSGGHAFICDGYRIKDKKFHFNWGWGGYCDGYYAMSALKTKVGTFNTDKAAIVGINPLKNRKLNDDEEEEMEENDYTWKEDMTKTSGNETTGIKQMADEAENDNAPYYDLNGVKVENPTKGLYIRNGKKVFVK